MGPQALAFSCFLELVTCFLLAIPQSIFPETAANKWHFPQENVTQHGTGEGASIVEWL